MKLMIAPESCGSEKLTFGIIWIPVGSTVKPCHSHPGTEEIIYICKGDGEAWVDGDITTFTTGDTILLPSGSKHMIRNIGDENCEVIFMYSPPTSPENYNFYPEIKFKKYLRINISNAKHLLDAGLDIICFCDDLGRGKSID